LVIEVLAFALDTLGIVDKEKFMNHFTTTIGMNIYVPFEIGTMEEGAPSLLSQMATCVHEHMHVKQHLVEPALFELKYLFDSVHRAAYEAKAYAANMEMHWWYNGKLLDTEKLANKLKGYAVDEADIQVTKKTLDMLSVTISRGGVVTKPMRVAMKWLKKRFPDHVPGTP